MYYKIKIGDRVISPIDWEMTPELSFGTYESWGGRERVRDNHEKVYYFFIDGWGEKPKVCLMERAVKHAKVLAEIDVPTELVADCVSSQGRVARFERSFAVDDVVREWLIDHVLEADGSAYVKPLVEEAACEDMGPPLPAQQTVFAEQQVRLPSGWMQLDDDDVDQAITQWDFFDVKRNPTGKPCSLLAKGEGSLTVIDERTGLEWQAGGVDICSIRMMEKQIVESNRKGFAGFHDWRLPSLEEAMSLMEANKNFKGTYLPPCFSVDQPFIFVSARRKPSGYWFVDYRQGTVFWASGTIPGGFGRLCRALR